MDYNVDDFINVLCLKNQLISVPIDKLLEVYDDMDNYITFIDTVNVLSNIDSAFLLNDPKFYEKIIDVINLKRFSLKDHNIRIAVEDIINYINSLKSISDEHKAILKIGYLTYQEEVREIRFLNQDDFKYALSYDAFVISSLKNNQVEAIENDDLFLSSINYLLETIPTFFLEEDIKNQTLNKLETIKQKRGLENFSLRKYAKRTYQKIKTQEE